MALSAVARGKRGVIESSDEEEIPSPPPLKRSKSRAETRPCPICNEPIPLRLLGKHAQLEAERVEHIIQQIGSEEPFYDERDEPGPSSRGRRSALKARKSFAPRSNGDLSLDSIGKAIQSIKRHRKRRQLKLKEMVKEDEEEYARRDPWTSGVIGGQIVCPICLATVRGDQGILEAHVDVCIANESSRLEAMRQEELALQQVNIEDDWEVESNGRYAGDVRGAGFHTRSGNSEDVEDDVDIDGDDQAVYGEHQFTEGDILPVVERRQPGDETEVDVDIENDEEELAIASPTTGPTALTHVQTPNEKDSRAISDEELAQVHLAIETAKKKGDKRAHIAALEAKIKLLESADTPSGSACRICLDPYNEPTLSTGCWHTCCRECWLRCLGSTMQCPICKRITVASDLRRIYL